PQPLGRRASGDPGGPGTQPTDRGGKLMFRRGEERVEDDQPEHGRRPIEAREVRMNEGASSEVTVVGKGARLEGTLVSAGSLRIDGQVKGKITADGDVMLSSQSQVEADIQANNATIAG